MQRSQDNSDTLKTFPRSIGKAVPQQSGAIKKTIALQPIQLADSVALGDSLQADSLRVRELPLDSLYQFGGPAHIRNYGTVFDDQLNVDYGPVNLYEIPMPQLRPQVEIQGTPLMRSDTDWVAGILLLCLVILASIRLGFNKYLGQLFSSAVSYTNSMRLFREKAFNVFFGSFRLDILFHLVLSLFVFQVFRLLEIDFGISQSIFVYLICLGIVVGYFLMKRFLYFLIAVTTETQPETQEYLFHMSNYNRVLGLFLLPVTIAIAYVRMYDKTTLVLSGVGVVLIFYTFLLIRGSKILLRKHFSISYLILYLCTLEFLPLLLIYQFVVTK